MASRLENVCVLFFCSPSRSPIFWYVVLSHSVFIIHILVSFTETEKEQTIHHRIKRGGYKKKKGNPSSSASGYYALPIPSLPQNVDKNRMRFLTRPNQKLINLANTIVNRRQGILPPTVNNLPPDPR